MVMCLRINYDRAGIRSTAYYIACTYFTRSFNKYIYFLEDIISNSRWMNYIITFIEINYINTIKTSY